MVRSFPIAASFVLCWMFSPDALVLLGNSVGHGGILTLVPLAVAAIVFVLAMSLIHHPSLATTSSNSFSNVSSELGPLTSMSLALAGHISLVLLLPTGILVTAGFTFNETFIYWFPNFAFSFLLLGLVLFLHLTGERNAVSLQPFFIVLTIGCLLLLCLAGLTTSQEIELPPVQHVNAHPLPLTLFCGVLLLFLGYDRQASVFSVPRSYYIWALLIGFTLLALWGFVSLKHVPMKKLADSTIPHITSAREILGQPGRIIMGIAIISSVCGLVNSLFLLATRSLQQMAEHLSLPSLTSPAWRQRILPVLFSLVIGVFMAAGLAGNENLDVYIYGALLFWLLTTGVHCLAAARKLHKLHNSSTLYHYLLSAIFPLATAWLAWTHEHTVTLIVFCFLVLALAASVAFSASWLCRKTFNPKNQHSEGEVS